MTGERCSSSTESQESEPDLGGILLQPELDRLFESLSDLDRRLILLLVKEGVVETESDLRDRTADDRELDHLTSYHQHLPKLDRCGYIDWDRDTGEISAAPRFDEVESLLELIHDHQDELPDRLR